MKNKGIWVAIGLILILGIGFTSYTRDYVARQPAERGIELYRAEAPQTAAMRAEADQETAAAPDMAALAEAGAGSAETAAAAPRAAAAGEAAESTAAAAAAKKDAAKTVEHLTSDEYLARFQDLDDEIAAHAKDTDTSSNYSVKARTENERKLWETELDRVVDDLSSRMSDGDREALILAQRDWYRTREATATERSSKQSGSALAELEYNSSIVASTRDRTFELVQTYKDILDVK